jgi:hypothetical protein
MGYGSRVMGHVKDGTNGQNIRLVVHFLCKKNVRMVPRLSYPLLSLRKKENEEDEGECSDAVAAGQGGRCHCVGNLNNLFLISVVKADHLLLFFFESMNKLKHQSKIRFRSMNFWLVFSFYERTLRNNHGSKIRNLRN